MTIYQVVELMDEDKETITSIAGLYTTLAEANKHVDWLYNKIVEELTRIYGDPENAKLDMDEEYDGKLIFSYKLYGIFHEVHICKGELKDHFEPES